MALLADDTTDNYVNPRLGFLYVLQNAHMPGIVKIGATRQHPLTRVKELSAPTGVPGEYKLAYYRSFGDCFLAESLTHEHYALRRINESREFFEVHVDEVIAFVMGLADSVAYRERVDASEPEAVVGGTHQRRAKPVATPMAELFATFPDDGEGRELTPQERALCVALMTQT